MENGKKNQKVTLKKVVVALGIHVQQLDLTEKTPS